MSARILKTIAGVLSAVLLGSGLAMAEGRVNKREKMQQERIFQGVKSGELTGREFARLEREQARIERNVAIARSDGRFTKREHARIEREQDRASRDIYRQKHDGQERR